MATKEKSHTSMENIKRIVGGISLLALASSPFVVGKLAQNREYGNKDYAIACHSWIGSNECIPPVSSKYKGKLENGKIPYITIDTYVMLRGVGLTFTRELTPGSPDYEKSLQYLLNNKFH